VSTFAQADWDYWNDKTTGDLVTKPVISGNELRLLGSKADNAAFTANSGNN
jgi:hypothetical protein